MFRALFRRVDPGHLLLVFSVFVIFYMAFQIGASAPDPATAIYRDCAFFYHNAGTAAEQDCRFEMSRAHAVRNAETAQNQDGPPSGTGDP